MDPSSAIGLLAVVILVLANGFFVATDMKLSDEVHEQVDTLGGLVMASLDRIPAVGDEVVVSGRRLRVEQLDGRRVEAVRLLPGPAAVEH